jgi:glutathione S-transferase
MRLIGMLDSPYVRRVAISLRLLDLPFTHDQVSVFRHFDEFAAINPVVKAPSLVLDDGIVLMDSSLILEHAERLAAPATLAPATTLAHARAQRIVGLALAAADKSVQIEYERKLRPAEKQHQPWLDRIAGQLAAAYRLLEAEIGTHEPWLFGDRPLQADVTSAVAFRFTTEIVPDAVDLAAFPRLAALSARAEATDAFRASPFS